MNRPSEKAIPMRSRFACARCGIVMTGALVPLADDSLVKTKDGADYLPKGSFAESDGEFFTATDGQWIVNLKDVINTRKHPDLRRLNGCCGLDGCNGINTICAQGHEIGTEKSDCWMPHAMLFDPLAVKMLSGDKEKANEP